MANHFEKIIPATQARKDFFLLLKGLQQPGKYYTITLEGKPVAVFLSFSEFNSWRETVEVASDQELADDLRQYKSHPFKASDFVPLEEVLRKEGFLVAERPKKKYVPRSAAKKGGKRAK